MEGSECIPARAIRGQSQSRQRALRCREGQLRRELAKRRRRRIELIGPCRPVELMRKTKSESTMRCAPKAAIRSSCISKAFRLPLTDAKLYLDTSSVLLSLFHQMAGLWMDLWMTTCLASSREIMRCMHVSCFGRFSPGAVISQHLSLSRYPSPHDLVLQGPVKQITIDGWMDNWAVSKTSLPNSVH